MSLTDPRTLAADPRLAASSEYLRAILQVLLAMHDQRAAELAKPAKGKT